MKSRTRVSSATLVFVCVVLLGSVAHAQYRGALQGTVTDAQGAVVSGARVTLVDKETNRTLEATTNDSGYYSFNGLAPRPYKMEVVRDGFKKKVLDDITIIAEQNNALNVELAVGQASEVVNVTDAAPIIDTATSNLSGTVTTQQIQALPSFGRDAFQLLQLAPGAFGDGAQGSGGGTNNLPGASMGGSGGTDGIFKIENGGQISVNGARVGSNNYQIDGVGTTSVTWGGASVITPNEDSIKEIKVVTDNYDAENGRYLGAQVQIISQNGTNNFHGSAFFKFHRPGLNAYQRYNGYNDTPKRDNNRFNDWGGSVGGPIWKNKLFFFFSYETLTNKQSALDQTGWYETPDLRALAASGTNAAAFYGFPGAGPFGGTQTDINPSDGSTLDCGFLGLVEGVNCHYLPGQGINLGSPLTGPRGTLDAGWAGTGNPGTGGNGSGGPENLSDIPTIAFYTGIRAPADSNHRQYNGRLDFNLTSKDLLAFSLYYVPNTSTGINGNGYREANTFNSNYKNRAYTLLWNHTFGATMANEARVNAAGWQNKDLADNPGAPWGLPQVSFNNFGNIGVQGLGIGSFNGFDQWTYAAKDVLTKVHGAHTMKMGGEFTRLLSVDAPFWSDRPGYTFHNIWDFLNDAPFQESVQSDPQTGVPSALRKDLRSSIWGLFFQDNWKVKPNFTLTAGLRWEYFGPITEKNDKLATVVLGQGANMFSDLRLRTGDSQFNAQKSNFGPQLGFAWSPGGVFGHDFNNKLVIRGGGGIAYNGVAQSNTLDVRFNPPFVGNQPTLVGTDINYIDSFPANINDPFGYAANPAAILAFDDRNLPIDPVTGAPKGRIELTALAKDQPTTYSIHYTIGGEYDLGANWVASVGYQGSQTRHLTQHYNLYNPASVLGILPNPRVSGLVYYGNDGSGHFNALLLGLRHNFSKSFQLEGQYRLSKSIDSGSNAYAGGFYQWDMGTNLAPSDFDTRHAFKVFGVWTPTIFRGSNGWMEKLVGGWTLSGILNAHTGFPWTPLYNFEGATDIGTVGGQLFDPVFNFGANAGGSSSSSGSSAYLPAAYNGGYHPDYRASAANPGGGSGFFTPPTLVPGTLFDCLFPNPDPVLCPAGQQGFGALPTAPGVGRNSFTGPGYFDFDATLGKSFGLPKMPILGEGAKLEIKANFYNLFNKLNLKGDGNAWSNGIQANIFNDHFGQARSALGARTIEMQARFNF
jgi:carboxypeptidase family protein